MKKSIEDYKNGECGSIKLGASGVPAHIFMPELIHQFAEQYPGIKISLDVRTAPEIENQLLLQELDCALLVETENKKEGLIYESITMDEIVLAFSNTHPIAKKNGLEIDDLNNQTLLVHRLSSSTGWFSNSLLREIKFDMETIQLDSVSTIIKMLSYGKTVALISKSLIEEEEDLSYRKLKDKELERKIYFVYNRDIWRNDPFKYFQTLVNQLKEE